MNTLQIRLPAPCSVSHRHALTLRVDAKGNLQRIRCSCKASDPEVIIMNATGEKTCLDSMNWILRQMACDDYLTSYKLGAEFPAGEAISDSLAQWIRQARNARTARKCVVLGPPASKVTRQSRLILQAVPRDTADRAIVEARYFAQTGTHTNWYSYAALELASTRIVNVCQIAGQASFGVFAFDPDFTRCMRRGDGTDLCAVCNANATASHRKSAKHIKRMQALARDLLGAVGIPVYTLDQARAGFGHEY